MDNNHRNNYSEYYDFDNSFDPFLHNLIDRDISIFDLSNDEFIALSPQQNTLPQHQYALPQQQHALPQQQNPLPQLLHELPQNQNVYPFGVEHIDVPFLNPTFQDQSMHGNYNFTIGGGVPHIDVEGPSRRKGEQLVAEHPLLRHGILNEEDVIALDHWPPSPKSFSCSCCQILRQIIHTDGLKFEKLEIHGSLGVIGHAIVHIQDMTRGGGEPPSEIYLMIDFSRKSIEQIRSFLVAYCKDQTRLGLVALDDPLSTYYDTICTGLDWAEHYNDGDDDLSPPNGIEPEFDSEPEPEAEPVADSGGPSTSKPKPKRNMAVQRKRVPKMTMNDLCHFFHLTIRDAADKLEVSDSVVKKISRLGGLKRWPQRKLQSLVKDVRVLRRGLNSPYPATRRRVRQEIQRLQREMVSVCGGVVPTGIEMVEFEEEEE